MTVMRMDSPEEGIKTRSSGLAITIERLTQADTGRVHELDSICRPSPWSQESIRDELERGEDCSLSANFAIKLEQGKKDRCIIGFGLCRFSLGESQVLNLAVQPEYQGEGLGGMLLDALLEESARSHISEITLEVRESNLRAQTLYRRKGFSVVGRRPGYYRNNGEDALLMAKSIETKGLGERQNLIPTSLQDLSSPLN